MNGNCGDGVGEQLTELFETTIIADAISENNVNEFIL